MRRFIAIIVFALIVLGLIAIVFAANYEDKSLGDIKSNYSLQ